MDWTMALLVVLVVVVVPSEEDVVVGTTTSTDGINLPFIPNLSISWEFASVS